jgi:hypothetical protein
MGNNIRDKKKQIAKKQLIVEFILLTIVILILISLYYLFINFGALPIILILIILFPFLLAIDPFLRERKKSLYSKIFPKKKKALKEEMAYRRKLRDTEIISKEIPQINLNFKYKKPAIHKCSNCGMILASFVKKCPICGERVNE